MKRLTCMLLLGALGACGGQAQDISEPVETKGEALTAKHAPRARWHHRRKHHHRLDEIAAESCCGFPGDRGNKLGVGRFCIDDRQCAGNAAAVACSSGENEVADHKSFYCTMPCDPDAPENICGPGAACGCEGELGCGCTPISCSEAPPEGCEGP